MDENLDEKKCPVCGRPNLSQAEKCWYCQAPLENSKETRQSSLLSEEDLLEQNGEGSSFVQSAMEEKTRAEPAAIPEWLRRVRELIAADRQQDEPADDWQQQQLFDVPKKHESKHAKTTPRVANPPPAAATPKEAKATAGANKKEVAELPEAPDDLPEGFTPISTQQNDKTSKG